MAQMPVAPATAHLHPHHAMRPVLNHGQAIIGNRGIKAGPARTGILFGVGQEKIRPAPGAPINAFGLVIGQRAGKGPFCPRLAQDMILFRGQARAPFGIGEQQFFHGLYLNPIAAGFKPPA